MWQSACDALCAPGGDAAWTQIVEASRNDEIWHSLKNCVVYQVGGNDSRITLYWLSDQPSVSIIGC